MSTAIIIDNSRIKLASTTITTSAGHFVFFVYSEDTNPLRMDLDVTLILIFNPQSPENTIAGILSIKPDAKVVIIYQHDQSSEIVSKCMSSGAFRVLQGHGALINVLNELTAL